MTIDDKDMINSILESVSRIDYIKPEDIPNIDLYMDQVTTFMEEQLVSSKRYADDKILTKTMINNYAKNKLLPPPEKKRYSKEHMLMLIFIYYFKNILSINDIQTLLTPITQKYFKSMTEKDMTYIYNEKGCCSSFSLVEAYDNAVLELCGLENGQIMEFDDFTDVVQKKILASGKRKEICGNCQWNSICESQKSRWEKC